MDTLIDFLAEARDAYRRNDWRASYAAFVRADGVGPLRLDDLDAYGAAAWRLGRGNEAVRLTERAYDRLVRTDVAGAAMKAALLALQWRARGHQALSRIWADRARGLIGSAAGARTAGYLAYLDASAALSDRDALALSRASSTLRQTVADAPDPTLDALGRIVGGIALLMQSRVAEGYRLLDEALLPMLDERIPPEWAGDVYRLVLRSDGYADPAHRQAWTESMRRWVTVTGVVIDASGFDGAARRP
jgi:hypothetical protein